MTKYQTPTIGQVIQNCLYSLRIEQPSDRVDGSDYSYSVVFYGSRRIIRPRWWVRLSKFAVFNRSWTIIWPQWLLDYWYLRVFDTSCASIRRSDGSDCWDLLVPYMYWIVIRPQWQVLITDMCVCSRGLGKTSDPSDGSDYWYLCILGGLGNYASPLIGQIVNVCLHSIRLEQLIIWPPSWVRLINSSCIPYVSSNCPIAAMEQIIYICFYSMGLEPLYDPSEGPGHWYSLYSTGLEHLCDPTIGYSISMCLYCVGLEQLSDPSDGWDYSK